MEIQSIVLEKCFTSEQVKQALSEVFHIATSKITVTEEYPILVDFVGHASLVSWQFNIGGDFPCRIEIFPLNDITIPFSKYEAEAEICEALNCRALVPSEELNPYSWILIHKKGIFQRVSVRAEELDQPDPTYSIQDYLDYI